MIFINVKDPDATLSMLPWFVAVDKSPIDIGFELSERLQDDPDNTLVIVAEQGSNVQAVVAAFVEANPETGQRHVFIWQGRSRAGFKYGKLLFEQIEQWAKGKDIRRIVLGTQRGRAMCRRFNMRPLQGDYFVKEI